MIGSSFEDLIDGKDLSLSTFGFELTSQVIPEFGLSYDFISSEESDSVNFRIGFLF